MVATPQQIEAYIRQSARQRGIDPETAVRVWKSEGAGGDPSEAWQSRVVAKGRREPSYGPFQLYMGGGLGNKFVAQTGLDPRDPGTWQQQVDFALDQAAQGGWSPWYGAAKVGVGDWTGLRGANPAGVPKVELTPEQQAFVQNNPQPGGYGPGIDDPNAPPAPPGGLLPGPNGGILAGGLGGGIPQEVAAYATRDDKDKKGLLGTISDALQKVPDAPAPKLGPMPDARRYGGLLNDFLEQPGIAQRMLQRRLG